MFVDVLKRYLLIVWNFFFGQVSTESIKDSPPSCTEDKPIVSADVVPPVEVDDNDDKIENGGDEDDDIEEIFNDEEGEELDLEDEDEIEGDQDEEKEPIVPPKKPEDKVITNDVPTKPSVPANKTEEVKAPFVVPKPKDEVKKPEPPKAPEEISEKPKIDIDNTKKSETPAKLKPEFETGEKEGAPAKAVSPEIDGSKFKSEFEVVEREDRDVVPQKPAKTEFEVAERGTVAVKPVLPPPPPPPSSSSSAVKKDDPPSQPSVKIGGGDNDGKEAPKPTTVQEKAAAHVKFQENDSDDTSGKGHAPVVDFATLEKGETVVKPPTVTTVGRNAVTGDAVGDFLSAEQSHGGQLLQKSHHESIQDQQLDYSDSGEELSDDDIEIDYEDDEDDEEVVEVKPLPPVARSVYKKND
ncbi:PREDICTED: protein IWS1 homolog [Diuraphis noxia]|uniref:protein IWS1 homolog n=1 Tax=Diuraphis noxia TaxID=143948 RepID=UPI0007635657|nr:PREDICTED: protein IWS1 homolog [Diuraphis noxia]XP_015378793.1 PREDICTED: protein IWS1 homolog [Diuraphis noxia]XP_015378794.1 PREDICTED: protein IWS1 homolog [Diuraphis noxia]XP_015378795.1 PREDICTED: protein IWS1 homolog [Diuraphis noxia]